jgi:hypothetical protein
MKTSTTAIAVAMALLRISQAEQVVKAFDLQLRTNPPMDATLAISINETAVDNSTSYFNTSMQLFLPATYQTNGSVLQAQVVRGVGGLARLGTPDTGSGCTTILGNDCSSEITNSYSTLASTPNRNSSIIPVFPSGPNCLNLLSKYHLPSPQDHIEGNFQI